MERTEEKRGEERRKEKGNIGKRQHEKYIRKCLMDGEEIIIKRETKERRSGCTEKRRFDEGKRRITWRMSIYNEEKARGVFTRKW